MNWTAARILGLVMIVGGVLSVSWGVQHFNDPIVVRNYKGYPLPGKDQFVAIALGVFLIGSGTVAYRTGRLP